MTRNRALSHFSRRTLLATAVLLAAIDRTFLYVSLAMDPISTTPGRQSQVLNSSYFTPGRKSHKKRPRTAVLDGRRVLATSVASEIVSPKRYSRSAMRSHLR